MSKVIAASSFREILKGYSSAQILAVPGHQVVRTLTVSGDMVEVLAANGESVEVPLDTQIDYEPWDFDRGSFIFGNESPLKIATEMDIVQYPDGNRFLLQLSEFAR